jgi:hypothetical protein
MGTRLHWLGALSFAASLAAAASPASAQPARPWVDPPSEAGASAPSSVPSPESHEVKPAPHQSSAISASTNATTKVEEPRREQVQQSSETSEVSVHRKLSTKSSPQKTVRESKVRKSPRDVTTARNERQRQVIQQREVAEQPARNTREERVRQGLNSGLEVMNLRTIEFPDGRRVQILTRPRPGSMSELLDRAE